MSSAINEAFVTRNGRFDYTIPGHVFVIKNNDGNKNQPTETFKEVSNVYFLSDCLITHLHTKIWYVKISHDFKFICLLILKS